MTPDEYLERVLENQELSEDEQDELQENRAEVEDILKKRFGSAARVRYAGSHAKGTMIRESYDLDLAYYFAHHDETAGATLQEIYDAAAEALSEDFYVEKKTSALRVKEKDAVVTRKDLHVDVIPGRYTDNTNTDVFLHQGNGSKERLKTNLKTHVEHIGESGVLEPIKLVKLWKCRNAIAAKTFVLELLVVKLLKQRKTASLKNQFMHVLTEFRVSSAALSVEDPANSNNDLKPHLDQVRADLQAWATITLSYIENGDWESVFGKLPEKQSSASLSATLGRVASSTAPVRPWLPKI